MNEQQLKQAQEILSLCSRINSEGRYHTFFSFSGHVNWINVMAALADTDYGGDWGVVMDMTAYTNGEDDHTITAITRGLEALLLKKEVA